MLNRLFFYILIISPLVYLTGGVEHVTPLSIANFLNLPSLSAINYAFFIVLILYIFFKSLNDTGKFAFLFPLILIISLVVFRESSASAVIFSAVSQLLITSPFLIMVGCYVYLNEKSVKKITAVYLFYLLLCVMLHYFFVSYYLMNGVALPNERAVGIFKNPNHLGVFAILTLIFVYQLAQKEFYNKNKVFIIEIFIAFIIYIAGSRSAQLFFIILILINSFLFNRKLFLSYLLFSVTACLLVLTSDIGVEKIETLLTKRESKDIAEAGNMRISILLDMVQHFDWVELLFGKGSGQGSAIYISHQMSMNDKVVWLDSNINTLTYTYGIVLPVIIIFILAMQLVRKIKVDVVSSYPILFILYFMWFINIGEFFPIIFMLLISTQTFKRTKKNDFNNYSQF